VVLPVPAYVYVTLEMASEFTNPVGVSVGVNDPPKLIVPEFAVIVSGALPIVSAPFVPPLPLEANVEPAPVVQVPFVEFQSVAVTTSVLFVTGASPTGTVTVNVNVAVPFELEVASQAEGVPIEIPAAVESLTAVRLMSWVELPVKV
jgi:hypothetical protein